MNTGLTQSVTYLHSVHRANTLKQNYELYVSEWSVVPSFFAIIFAGNTKLCHRLFKNFKPTEWSHYHFEPLWRQRHTDTDNQGKKNHSPSVYLTLLTMTISRNVGGSLGYASAGVYLSTGCILCPNTLHLGSIAFQWRQVNSIDMTLSAPVTLRHKLTSTSI